jgi:hypothetical protein
VKHSRLLACQQECQANERLFSEISKREVSRFEKHVASIELLAFVVTESGIITEFS